MVKPKTLEELSAVMRVLYGADVPMIVYGGGSNVVGAIRNRQGAAAIDMRDMMSIEPVNTTDCTVAVDAGAMGGELEQQINKQGFTLGHYPQSLHLSTVGGWISLWRPGASPPVTVASKTLLSA